MPDENRNDKRWMKIPDEAMIWDYIEEYKQPTGDGVSVGSMAFAIYDIFSGLVKKSERKHIFVEDVIDPGLPLGLDKPYKEDELTPYKPYGKVYGDYSCGGYSGKGPYSGYPYGGYGKPYPERYLSDAEYSKNDIDIIVPELPDEKVFDKYYGDLLNLLNKGVKA